MTTSAITISRADVERAAERIRPYIWPTPLVPSRWLSSVDPLPHTWDVTSDSIAAWVAGAVGATRLVLVKPPGAGAEAVDAYFHRGLPPDVGPPEVIPADQIATLRRRLTL